MPSDQERHQIQPEERNADQRSEDERSARVELWQNHRCNGSPGVRRVHTFPCALAAIVDGGGGKGKGGGEVSKQLTAYSQARMTRMKARRAGSKPAPTGRGVTLTIRRENGGRTRWSAPTHAGSRQASGDRQRASSKGTFRLGQRPSQIPTPRSTGAMALNEFSRPGRERKASLARQTPTGLRRENKATAWRRGGRGPF